MADKGTPVKKVMYKMDDGRDAHALVLDKHGDTYNLAWLDPDSYAWHAANSVPDDRVK